MYPSELQVPGAIRLVGTQTEKLRLVHSASAADFYPAEARRKGLDGLVTVDLFVNELGLVVEAKVLTESPKGQGFGLAALDVAKTYEFENTLKKLVLISMTIQFQP
jgi:TonB family protein